MLLGSERGLHPFKHWRRKNCTGGRDCAKGLESTQVDYTNTRCEHVISNALYKPGIIHEGGYPGLGPRRGSAGWCPAVLFWAGTLDALL